MGLGMMAHDHKLDPPLGGGTLIRTVARGTTGVWRPPRDQAPAEQVPDGLLARLLAPQGGAFQRPVRHDGHRVRMQCWSPSIDCCIDSGTAVRLHRVNGWCKRCDDCWRYAFRSTLLAPWKRPGSSSDRR